MQSKREETQDGTLRNNSQGTLGRRRKSGKHGVPGATAREVQEQALGHQRWDSKRKMGSHKVIEALA